MIKAPRRLGGQLPSESQISLLLKRHHAGRPHHDQQHRESGAQGSEPEIAPPGRRQLVLLPLVTGRQERALKLVQPVLAACGPLTRAGQPRAPVQELLLAPALVPLAGRLGHAPVDPQPLPVLGEPSSQGRSLADQRLLGDLRAVLVKGDQARLGQ